jgi:hypothetical protein
MCENYNGALSVGCQDLFKPCKLLIINVHLVYTVLMSSIKQQQQQEQQQQWQQQQLSGQAGKQQV